MYTINKNKSITNIPPSVFVDIKFSYYSIYKFNGYYIILQLIRLNDGQFQWFAIGKPLLLSTQFDTIRNAIIYMTNDVNNKSIVISTNDDYGNISNLINTVNLMTLNNYIND